ncbi:MAG: SGNH/GDSL hydrolase family protein [Reyranellaceae bacterium]
MILRRWFWLVYGAILLLVTVAGTELVASFLVPTWPARDLRPVSAEALKDRISSVFADMPQLVPVYNDWGMRDRPRSFVRPADVAFRSVMVGDSFLEGLMLASPLPARVELRWREAGQADMEAINLGVSATGPQQYYYRIRDVVTPLKPDLIVVMVYAGNDFVSTGLEPYALPPWIAELPMPSALGLVAPRTTWLLVNRLGLSELGRGNRAIPDEFALLNEWARKPPAERLDYFVRHIRTHYYPNVDEATIRGILSRGGDRLWTAFRPRPADREFVQGWLLGSMVDWETGTWEVPRTAEEADQRSAPMVEETLSWLLGANELAKNMGARLVVALAPSGVVDPDYVEFWRPWPRYFSYNLSSDARHRRLAGELHRRGLSVVDLRDSLNGVAGTYRLTDGHWTEKGTDIVAQRLSSELMDLRKAVDGRRQGGADR